MPGGALTPDRRTTPMADPSITSLSAADGAVVTDIITIGASPAASMSMVYSTMSSSIGMIMQNAATAERAMQQIAQSTVVTTCAMIISNAAKGP